MIDRVDAALGEQLGRRAPPRRSRAAFRPRRSGGMIRSVTDDAVAALDQRLRLPRHVELQREIVRPLVTGHVQDVAEAAGGDHADFGALALDHHIRGDRRAVEHEVHVARRHACDLADLEHAAHHASLWSAGVLGHFVHDDLLPAVRCRSCSRTMSVNVPPTSTPTRFMAFALLGRAVGPSQQLAVTIFRHLRTGRRCQTGQVQTRDTKSGLQAKP